MAFFEDEQNQEPSSKDPRSTLKQWLAKLGLAYNNNPIDRAKGSDQNIRKSNIEEEGLVHQTAIEADHIKRLWLELNKEYQRNNHSIEHIPGQDLKDFMGFLLAAANQNVDQNHWIEGESKRLAELRQPDDYITPITKLLKDIVLLAQSQLATDDKAARALSAALKNPDAQNNLGTILPAMLNHSEFMQKLLESFSMARLFSGRSLASSSEATTFPEHTTCESTLNQGNESTTSYSIEHVGNTLSVTLKKSEQPGRPPKVSVMVPARYSIIGFGSLALGSVSEVTQALEAEGRWQGGVHLTLPMGMIYDPKGLNTKTIKSITASLAGRQYLSFEKCTQVAIDKAIEEGRVAFENEGIDTRTRWDDVASIIRGTNKELTLSSNPKARLYLASQLNALKFHVPVPAGTSATARAEAELASIARLMVSVAAKLKTAAPHDFNFAELLDVKQDQADDPVVKKCIGMLLMLRQRYRSVTRKKTNLSNELQTHFAQQLTMALAQLPADNTPLVTDINGLAEALKMPPYRGEDHDEDIQTLRDQMTPSGEAPNADSIQSLNNILDGAQQAAADAIAAATATITENSRAIADAKADLPRLTMQLVLVKNEARQSRSRRHAQQGIAAAETAIKDQQEKIKTLEQGSSKHQHHFEQCMAYQTHIASLGTLSESHDHAQTKQHTDLVMRIMGDMPTEVDIEDAGWITQITTHLAKGQAALASCDAYRAAKDKPFANKARQQAAKDVLLFKQAMIAPPETAGHGALNDLLEGLLDQDKEILADAFDQARNEAFIEPARKLLETYQTQLTKQMDKLDLSEENNKLQPLLSKIAAPTATATVSAGGGGASGGGGSAATNTDADSTAEATTTPATIHALQMAYAHDYQHTPGDGHKNLHTAHRLATQWHLCNSLKLIIAELGKPGGPAADKALYLTELSQLCHTLERNFSDRTVTKPMETPLPQKDMDAVQRKLHSARAKISKQLKENDETNNATMEEHSEAPQQPTVIAERSGPLATITEEEDEDEENTEPDPDATTDATAAAGGTDNNETPNNGP